MKAFLLLLLISLNVWPADNTPEKAIHSIAILDLEGSGLDQGEVKTLSDALRNNIIELNKFSVLERSKMDVILKEQGFQQSGACTNEACAVEMGQLLGVDAMVIGSVGKVGKTYSITVRMLDLVTGRIIHSASQYYKGEIDGLLTETIVDVARKIVSPTVKKTPEPVQAVADATTPPPAPAVPSQEKPPVEQGDAVKGKSNTLMIVVVSALLVVGGVGAYLYLQGVTDDPPPTDDQSDTRVGFPVPPSHNVVRGGN